MDFHPTPESVPALGVNYRQALPVDAPVYIHPLVCGQRPSISYLS
jgi:hypothetical protein